MALTLDRFPARACTLLGSPDNLASGTGARPAVVGSTSRGCVEFDPATNGEQAWFPSVVTQDYDGNGVDVALHWGCTDAASGTFKWAVGAEVVTDLDAGPILTDVSTTVSVPAVAGRMATTTLTLTHAQFGHSAGEPYRLHVRAFSASGLGGHRVQLIAAEVATR